MKAILVDCINFGEGKKRSSIDIIPYAPRAIAWILEKNKISYTLLPFNKAMKEDLSSYDILLISSMTLDKKSVKTIIKKWKRENDGKVILGGPITSSFDILQKINCNIAIYGEGEETLNELLNNNLNPENIKGLTYKKENKIYFNEPREILSREKLNYYKAITNISMYPFYYASRVYVEVVRGCSNWNRALVCKRKCLLCRKGSFEERLSCPEGILPGCGYCSVPSFHGYARSKSIKRIKEEVEGLIKNGATKIVLSAPDFLDYGRDLLINKPLTNPSFPKVNYEEIKKLLDSLYEIDEINKGEVSLLIEQVKANLIDEKIAKLLSNYGIKSIHIGIETGSDELAYKIGRPFLPKDALRAISILRKNKINVYAYFIYGLPFQSKEDVKETLQYLERIKDKVTKINLYKFLPLPLSTFSKFSRGNENDEDNKKIIEKVNFINERAKKKMIGKEVKAIVANKVNDYFVCYPLNDSFTIFVKGKLVEGEKVKVKIIGYSKYYFLGKVICSL